MAFIGSVRISGTINSLILNGWWQARADGEGKYLGALLSIRIHEVSAPLNELTYYLLCGVTVYHKGLLEAEEREDPWKSFSPDSPQQCGDLNNS